MNRTLAGALCLGTVFGLSSFAPSANLSPAGSAPASENESGVRPAEDSQTVLQWKFNFDRTGNSADAGLSVSFSRGVGTIDPTGVEVAGADSPRFDRAFRLAAVPAPTAAVHSQANSQILASGLDANGTDELMVYLQPDGSATLKVFVDGVFMNANTTPLFHMDTGSSALNEINPLLACLPLPEYDPDDYQFRPVSALVFHGAVILAGPVLIPDIADPPGTWTFGGWGFAINNNHGDPDDWHLLWDDVASAPQVNYNRGREWCLKACPAHNRGANPLEFWVCCTDYRWRPAPEPNGGRVYVARMKRNNTSSPWAIDHGSAAFETFDLSEGAPDDDFLPIAGCHAHSAYVMEYGATGETYKRVQVLVSLGDDHQNNRFARLIWNNNSTVNGDFTTGWTTYDDFHGSKSPAEDRGTWGMQPVGVAGMYETQEVTVDNVATTYHKPSLIWGSDVQSEWLVQTTLPLPNASPDQLTCKHLWGWSTGFGAERTYLKWPYFLVGTITESRPAGLGPLVAVVYDTSPAGTDADLFSRILYHPGIGTHDLDAWHQVAAVRGVYGGATAALFKGDIWYTQTLGTNPGLYKVPEPTDDTTEFQPIIVSPGGYNLVHEDYNVDDDVGDQIVTVTPLDLEDPGVPGIFEDNSAPLPACPTMATHAWRVETSRAQEGSPDKFITRIHVSSDSLSTWNALTPVWNTENRIRRYRAWVLDNSFNKENPAPNKTIQMSSQIHNVPGNSPFPNEPSFTLYSCSNRWCPATFVAYHDFDIASGVAKALGLVIRSSWAGAAHPDDNNFYLVVDSALDSFGSLPYPMAHSTGTVAPGSDELLTITRVTNGPVLDLSQEFSLRVAGLLPEGDWDHYAQRKANDQSEPADKRFWPLFTLWADDNNYIEFRADCVNKGFEIRAQLNGTTYTRDFGDGYQLWLPNSQFYALISFKPIVSIPPGPAPATSYQYNFYFGASLGGGPVALASSPITVTTSPSPLGATFSQLRFRGGPDAIPNNAEKDNEVVTMRWVGGDFQTGSGSSYTTSTTIKSAFSDDTLAWVKGP